MKRNNNLSAFILQHPDLSVNDLIQEASKKGLVLTKNYVYNTRSKARTSDEGSVTTPTKKVKVKAVTDPTKKVKVKAVAKEPVAKEPKHRAAGQSRPPVAIVFFDSAAFVKGLKGGFKTV